MIFKNILNKEFKVVLSAALTISFFSLVAKLLGLVRNRIFAGEFGAGDTLDVYFAAFRIPDFLYNILIIGILSSVFIPVFSEYLARNEKEAWKLANTVMTAFLVVFIVCCLFAILFAPQLISLVAPGFDGAKKEMAVTLTRIMFLSPVLLGISNIVGNMLQVYKMFFSFALAPVMYNIGIIIGAVFFVKPLGVTGLAWGVVLGALLHLIVQVIPALKTGFRFHFLFDFAHVGLRKIALLSLPRTIGLAAYQFNFIVITSMASTAAAGSIAIFNFANDLQFVPIGIVALSFVSAVFPMLSIAWAKKDTDTFLRELYLTISQILYLVIPISLFLILERAQIVRVILGYGQFSWENTRLTAAALGAFAISIFAQCLIPLFTRAFYAIHDTKTPVFINVFSVFINIFFSFYFLSLMRQGGAFAAGVAQILKVSDISDVSVLALPLAFSVSSIINFFWLYLAFSYAIKQFNSDSIVRSLVKINIAVLVMSVAVYITLHTVAFFVNMQTFAGIFMQGTAAFLVGLGIYGASSYVLDIPEFFTFWQALYLPVKKIFLSRIFPIQVNGSDKL